VGVLGNPYGADLGPLWHSEYDGQSPLDADVANGPELERYGGWNDCLVWQHTSTGRVPGISGGCDRNIFYGAEPVLLALAGLWGGEPAKPTTALEARTVDICTNGPDGRVHQVVVGEDHAVYHSHAATAAELADAQIESLGGRARAVSATWHGERYVVVCHGFPEDVSGTVRERAYTKEWTGTEWTEWQVQPWVNLARLG
jgi:hypothetical protein